MKQIDKGNRPQPESPSAEEPMSMDRLERPVEPRTPDKKRTEPAVTKKDISSALSGLERRYEKYIVPSAVGLVILMVLAYTVATAIPKDEDVPDPVPSQGTVQESPPAGVPEDIGGTSGVSQGPMDQLDEIPDGEAIGDGFRSAGAYWCVTPRTKEKSHKIHVPSGWEAQPVAGGIRLKPEGFSEAVQGAEAISLWWDSVPHIGDLEEHGFYDGLDGRTDGYYSEDLYQVIDSWIQDDSLGGQHPVYVVRHTRTAAGGAEAPNEDLDEYKFFAVKPYQNGDAELYFVGTVDASTFQAMSSPRFDTVPALVRELFPPSAEMQAPEGWGDPATQSGIPDVPDQDSGSSEAEGTGDSAAG